MGLNQGRKARVIAKIKGFTDLEPETADEASRRWISVHKPNGDDSETVTVSFGDQSARVRKRNRVLKGMKFLCGRMLPKAKFNYKDFLRL
ncbi:kinesin-like protein KIF22-like protein [Corchorus olitorius]|uniref:Kinesin-like protein KIF22-like protein n=1 Tax=Corchorus olitorius TaxID=93759 RepID=A0A1R3HN93_9ROSI|nr:kinesin-like protein KIF22-like protein [Corchorus olitorius]